MIYNITIKLYILFQFGPLSSSWTNIKRKKTENRLSMVLKVPTAWSYPTIKLFLPDLELYLDQSPSCPSTSFACSAVCWLYAHNSLSPRSCFHLLLLFNTKLLQWQKSNHCFSMKCLWHQPHKADKDIQGSNMHKGLRMSHDSVSPVLTISCCHYYCYYSYYTYCCDICLFLSLFHS